MPVPAVAVAENVYYSTGGKLSCVGCDTEPVVLPLFGIYERLQRMYKRGKWPRCKTCGGELLYEPSEPAKKLFTKRLEAAASQAGTGAVVAPQRKREP